MALLFLHAECEEIGTLLGSCGIAVLCLCGLRAGAEEKDALLAADSVRWWLALARLTVETHMGTRAHCCWHDACVLAACCADVVTMLSVEKAGRLVARQFHAGNT